MIAKKYGPFHERILAVEKELRKLGHKIRMNPVGANAVSVYCDRCHNSTDIVFSAKHEYRNNQGLNMVCDPAIRLTTHEVTCILRRPATGHRQRIYRHKRTQQLHAEYIRDDGSSGPNHMLTPLLLHTLAQDLYYDLLRVDEGKLPAELQRAIRAAEKGGSKPKKSGKKK